MNPRNQCASCSHGESEHNSLGLCDVLGCTCLCYLSLEESEEMQDLEDDVKPLDFNHDEED